MGRPSLNCPNTKTPGSPGVNVVRPTSESEKVSNKMQTTYRSGVGMLFYLAKHTRPNIANAVREL